MDVLSVSLFPKGKIAELSLSKDFKGKCIEDWFQTIFCHNRNVTFNCAWCKHSTHSETRDRYIVQEL